MIDCLICKNIVNKFSPINLADKIALEYMVETLRSKGVDVVNIADYYEMCDDVDDAFATNMRSIILCLNDKHEYLVLNLCYECFVRLLGTKEWKVS